MSSVVIRLLSGSQIIMQLNKTGFLSFGNYIMLGMAIFHVHLDP